MRFLSIVSLLVSAAALASASTLSTTCTQNVYMTQSGSGQNVVCGGFTAPIGSAITDIKWGFGRHNLLRQFYLGGYVGRCSNRPSVKDPITGKFVSVLNYLAKFSWPSLLA